MSGDGNMLADIVILSDEFEEGSMLLTRTYKVIKGYLGVAKRDLKLHGDQDKKRFHAFRSLMMANMLMDNKLPTVEDIIELKGGILPDKKTLEMLEREYRTRLNTMLDKGELNMYPKFEESDDLVNIMFMSNNIREFKY